MTGHREVGWGWGWGWVADGVGEERLSPSEDYSHPSLIVADAGTTFPKFGTNFLSASSYP